MAGASCTGFFNLEQAIYFYKPTLQYCHCSKVQPQSHFPTKILSGHLRWSVNCSSPMNVCSMFGVLFGWIVDFHYIIPKFPFIWGRICAGLILANRKILTLFFSWSYLCLYILFRVGIVPNMEYFIQLRIIK